MTKKFKLQPDQISELIPNMGGCIAPDTITVDGLRVGFMYREKPDFETDSGWRFFSGTETQDYADDSNNFQVYEVNTIANYDKAIIPYLKSPIGTELERKENSNEFVVVEEDE